MKIGEVGLHDVRGQAVFPHDLFIRVAFAAHFGDTLTVCNRVRTLDIMRFMAIHTHGDVIVLLVQERATVNAFCIDRVDVEMTFLAAIGAVDALPDSRAYGMRVVAVGTDWGIEVSLAELGIVDTVLNFCVFVEMAASAYLG